MWNSNRAAYRKESYSERDSEQESERDKNEINITYQKEVKKKINAHTNIHIHTTKVSEYNIKTKKLKQERRRSSHKEQWHGQ